LKLILFHIGIEQPFISDYSHHFIYNSALSGSFWLKKKQDYDK